MKGEHFIFPIADGTAKNSGEDQNLRHPPLSGIDQTKEKNKIFFEENQKGLLQPHDTTHHGMMVKPNVIFRSISGDFIYRHHGEPRLKLYVPTEESVPIPLKYIDVARTTHTTLDVMEKSIDDYCNVHGDREL